MLHPRPLQWLASSAIALCVSGCAPDEQRSRIVTDLPSEGYALFRVKPGGAKRVAFVVEMRDVVPGERSDPGLAKRPVSASRSEVDSGGNFVLLYTPNEPKSSGWFELDASAYFPCRHYGPDSTDDVELGCIVPNGHGALVDAVVARDISQQLLLRHQLGEEEEDTTTSSSGSSRKATPGGWYAVMRIAKNGPAVPMAVEVIAMDETEPYDGPKVERIR